MKLSVIKRDVLAAEQGVWVKGALGDIDLLIAANNNEKYTKMLQKLAKPYKRNLDDMENKVFVDLQNKVLAKTVLLGWKGIEAEDSTKEDPKYIDYTTELAYSYLSDPENHKFRETVISLADEEEVFNKESIKAATFQA